MHNIQYGKVLERIQKLIKFNKNILKLKIVLRLCLDNNLVVFNTERVQMQFNLNRINNNYKILVARAIHGYIKNFRKLLLINQRIHHKDKRMD